jgi:hypothetical protein
MEMKERLKDLASGVLGAGIGYGYSLYREIAARANVAVRPELAKVDWMTALLSDHFEDWLFYHFPNEMKIIYAAIGCVAGYLLFKYVVKD